MIIVDATLRSRYVFRLRFRCQIESERKAVVRQSAAAILEASADEKLRKAFENIEDLSRKLGETECKLRDKVPN